MTSQAPDGSIVITPKEFYDGVKSDIAHINKAISDLSSNLSPLPGRVDKLESRADKADERMDATDRKFAWAAGFAACGGTLVGAIVSAVVPKLFG